MLRILVISDTHIPVAAEKLPAVVEEEAKHSDYCLHAGDFISPAVVEQISTWTKFYGVYGNMDDSQVKGKLPHKQVIEFEGIKLGLIHGRGGPQACWDYIRDEFAQEFGDLAIIVFGHLHTGVDKEMDGKIFFNPGSPTEKVFTPFLSYGILEIENKTIKRRIVKIE